MKVRDILTEKPIGCIMVRCNSPVSDEDDTLFGYCQWDGKELIPLDGDSYYLDEKISKYIFDTGIDGVDLIYWIHVDWE